MQVNVTITGDKELADKLKRLGTSFFDFSQAMRTIGAEAARYYANQGFASQGGVFQKIWSPLNQNYAVRKSKLYRGRPPLVASGTMQNSFEYQYGPQQVAIGNSAPYFKYHQSALPRTRLPRRAVMGINEPIRQMVIDTISASVKQKIGEM